MKERNEFKVRGYYYGSNAINDEYVSVMTLDDGEAILDLINIQTESIQNLQSQINDLKAIVERQQVKLN